MSTSATNSPRMKLSRHQLEAVAAIHCHGCEARHQSGGFWSGLDGIRLEARSQHGNYNQAVGTPTIRALERMGVLRRMHRDERAWADPLELTEEWR